MSMLPSERAKAAGAPVEVDISKIEPGMILNVEWQGKPVWVVHRTKEMLAALSKLDSKLVDPKSEIPQQPDYCKNATAFHQAGNSGGGRYLHPSWDALRPTVQKWPPQTWVLTGSADSSARATVPVSTWPRGFIPAFLRLPIW